MSRKKTLSGKKKIALLVGAAALVGGTAIVMTGTSQASVACDGLAQAIRNNENFIAGQRANPDAQSAARIANREAVIAQIKVQQGAAGCEVGEGSGEAGGGQAAPPAQPPAEEQPPGMEQPPADEGAEEQPPADDADNGDAGAGGDGGAVGQVVCAGSTVTLSGEGGAPAASSNQFPIGTQLKVTNLDNNKSTTVEVTSVSGSCALLNNAAFEQVREPGKFLIRKARIETVG
ncbi:hypothetical protein [Streptomyces sp. NPDC002133]|uniref:hypothetical protein n=1 Tax=Streptomyces sp. NPDC002133 TaxID=3154409 RepID=UPI00332DF870